MIEPTANSSLARWPTPVKDASGDRQLIQLGSMGGQIPTGSTLIAHTQPAVGDISQLYGAQPSADDIAALKSLGQQSSYIVAPGPNGANVIVKFSVNGTVQIVKGINF